MTPQHALQARDDSIAGFQLLQQQARSPKHQQRLDLMASQLQDTQAQLLTMQVLIHSSGQQDRVQYCCCTTILHGNTVLLVGLTILHSVNEFVSNMYHTWQLDNVAFCNLCS